MKDIETLEKRIDKFKSAKTGDKAAKATFDLDKTFTHLEEGNNARSFPRQVKEELIEISEFQIHLPLSPYCMFCNVDEGSAITGNEYSKTIEDLVKQKMQKWY